MDATSPSPMDMASGVCGWWGLRTIETFPQEQIKRVRVVRRADGYYVQFCVQADRQVEHQSDGQTAGH